MTDYPIDSIIPYLFPEGREKGRVDRTGADDVASNARSSQFARMKQAPNNYRFLRKTVRVDRN